MISLKTEGHYSPEASPKGSLMIDATAEGFQVQLSLDLEESLVVDEEKPAFLFWELTPKRFDSLMLAINGNYQREFELQRPAAIHVQLSELSCPTTFPKSVNRFLCQSGIVGSVEVGAMLFQNRETKEGLIIEDIKGKIEGIDFSSVIDFAAEGMIYSPDVPAEKKSSFNLVGRLLQLWTEEGKFNRQGLTLDVDLDLEHLPVYSLTSIFPLSDHMREMTRALLGDLLNARFLGTISELKGPLSIDINASNFKAMIPLTLEKDHFSLRDTVDAEVTITENVSETFLKEINPLLLTGARSERPIKLYITSEGFYLPLHPYRFQDVKANVVIDIGKIYVKNGGELQELIEFVKASDVSREGWMEAWFTPIFMQLDEGIAHYKRFDMLLANELHIALWGSVDLINDRVNMVLGIAPSVLEKRFKIKGLSSEDLFQVKMKGSTSDIDLDWSAASKRIGILVTKTAGGFGFLLGSILEQFLSDTGEKKAPPPTTYPYPWDR